jgi:signal peptidase II
LRQADRRRPAEGASPRAALHGLQASRGASAVDAAPPDATPAEERSTSGRSPYLGLALVAAVVVALDQIAKEWALRALSDGPIDAIDGILRWRLTFNPGGAFGIFQDHSELFLVATVIVIALILLWIRKLDEPRLALPLALIVGGGLGNVADRIFRGHDGRVVDFIDLHVWPVFNVADMAVVTGVLLILFMSFRSEGR